MSPSGFPASDVCVPMNCHREFGCVVRCASFCAKARITGHPEVGPNPLWWNVNFLLADYTYSVSAFGLRIRSGAYSSMNRLQVVLNG